MGKPTVRDTFEMNLLATEFGKGIERGERV
jgi:hypothetical protein